jgi:hypothetical protein
VSDVSKSVDSNLPTSTDLLGNAATKLTPGVKLEAMEKILRWVDFGLIALVTLLLISNSGSITGLTLGLLLIQVLLTINLAFLLSKQHKNAHLEYLADHINRVIYHTAKEKPSESVDSRQEELDRRMANQLKEDGRFADYYWLGHMIVWLLTIFSLL